MKSGFIEPFVWMFEQKGFVENFKRISFVGITAATFAIICITLSFTALNKNIVGFIPLALAAIAILIAFLFITGYYWELTENIIDRETDISTSSIYSGKVLTIQKISLPDIDIPRMAWRGFASIVASALMFLPFFVITVLTLGVSLFTTFHPNLIISSSSIILISLLITMLAPALLWNYAKMNSIVAVWNIFKAIYLVGNYTMRYVIRVVGIICVQFISSILCNIIGFICQSMLNFGEISVFKIILIILCMLITYIGSIYFVFVQAFLLGTIAPAGEN